MEKHFILRTEYILIKQLLQRVKEHNDGILEEFSSVYNGRKEGIDEDRIYTLSTYINNIIDLASNKLN